MTVLNWFVHDSTTAALARRILGRRQPPAFQDTMRSAYDGGDGLGKAGPAPEDRQVLNAFTWLLIGAGIGFLVLLITHCCARAGQLAQVAVFLPSLRAARMRRRDKEAARAGSVWSYRVCPVTAWVLGFFVLGGLAIAAMVYALVTLS